MGSIFVFAIVTLWLIVMLPAVAAPFFFDRPKHRANTPADVKAIPLRHQTIPTEGRRSLEDRTAA